MRTVLLSLCSVAFGSLLNAGLWDRDRPDALQLDAAISIIVGRFERLEPAFYEARLERLRRTLSSLPEAPLTPLDVQAIVRALPDFDDASVSLMRMGEFQQALLMLDQKLLRIEQVREHSRGAARNHELRAIANRAAFLAARFALSDQSISSDAEQAAKLLQRLAELDPFHPDLPYSPRRAEWLFHPPEWRQGAIVQPNLLGLIDEDVNLPRQPGTLARLGHAAAIAYFSRLVLHGGAWEDVDVIYALSLAFWLEGRDEEAITAWLRVDELLAGGRTSRVRNAPTGLARRMAAHLGLIEDLKLHQQAYQEARFAADQWVSQRNEFAAQQLRLGRHPDTDSTFWADFGKAPLPAPGAYSEQTDDSPLVMNFVVGGMAVLAVLIALMGLATFLLGRRHAPAPTIDEV